MVMIYFAMFRSYSCNLYSFSLQMFDLFPSIRINIFHKKFDDDISITR